MVALDLVEADITAAWPATGVVPWFSGSERVENRVQDHGDINHGNSG